MGGNANEPDFFLPCTTKTVGMNSRVKSIEQMSTEERIAVENEFGHNAGTPSTAEMSTLLGLHNTRTFCLCVDTTGTFACIA